MSSPVIRYALCILLQAGATLATAAEPQQHLVSNANDSGSGSLRQALLDSQAQGGPQLIRLAADRFPEPATLTLQSPLPRLHGDITVDGMLENRLWQASGLTISGGGLHRILEVATDAHITLRNLSLADGYAPQGGAIFSRGQLVITGVTLHHNRAAQDGGAMLIAAGNTILINSTLYNNQAGRSGGGIAQLGGELTLGNATLAHNAANKGGALYSRGPLRLRNSILANSQRGEDCLLHGKLLTGSGYNLIMQHSGCGQPVSQTDPLLEAPGYYNGPTLTLPLSGGSPAINLGRNELALDENEQPLTWDQRGNGDPRRVAGFTDIGAFEVQAYPQLVVNSLADGEWRACGGRRGDCTLRGAMMLANAMGHAAAIRFDPQLFTQPQTLLLATPLPTPTVPLTLDASNSAPVTLHGAGLSNSPLLQLRQVVLTNPP